MQRRNFIKTTGIVCSVSGALGGSFVWNLLTGTPSINFPENFSQKEKSHIVQLFNDIKKDINFDYNKEKWAKRMLQPKRILEQKTFLGGYSTSFINTLGNTVTIIYKKGKYITKFS